MKVGGDDCLRNEVSFTDPRPLLVWEDNGDGVIGRGLEGLNERVDVRGGLVRGRTIVVHDLRRPIRGALSVWGEECKLARMCILRLSLSTEVKEDFRLMT